MTANNTTANSTYAIYDFLNGDYTRTSRNITSLYRNRCRKG